MPSRLSRFVDKIRLNHAGQATEEELRLREQVRQRINSLTETERQEVETRASNQRTKAVGFGGSG